MIRTVFLIVVLAHGLIHLLGFAKAFGHADLPQLTQPIPRGRGLLWLTAGLLMLATAASLLVWPRGWWLLGALALVISQVVILSSWRDAKAGTVANLVLLAGVLYGLASEGPWSLRADYERSTRPSRAVASAEAVLTEADLAALPEPVRRYVRQSGALGQPRPRSFRATWTGRIRSSPSASWMAFTAEQENRLDLPRRHFLMDASMKGLPVSVLHAFDERGATMRVRLLSLASMVDAKGAELTRAETVTLFNDLCILAPGALTSPLIAWEPIDGRQARASSPSVATPSGPSCGSTTWASWWTSARMIGWPAPPMAAPSPPCTGPRPCGTTRKWARCAWPPTGRRCGIRPRVPTPTANSSSPRWPTTSVPDPGRAPPRCVQARHPAILVPWRRHPWPGR
ncbi:MAG: hypothetical protein IPN91_11415 [Holophagaceae bacterium]|uniref:Uncharacterized protein n=1 Tax=Candidatus Geothrix odensensis TaxID=2954440 RepID=A0A936K6T8_9BACT|nr:hypothetical protein [Candidatus Geothrix odensensis]